MPVLPNMRVGAHVEVFKDDGNGGRVLVHTSRPCANCGLPLDGIVIPSGESQVHAVCPKEAPRG